MTEQITRRSTEVVESSKQSTSRSVWSPIRPGRGALTVLVVAAVAGFLLPLVIQERHYVSLAVDMGILAIFASGVGFLARQCGLVSFGHAAFYGGSAYIVAVLLDKTPMSPTSAVAMGIAGSTLLAASIGMLIVRVPGISFAILTLAIAQLVYVLVLQNRGLAGGNDGVAVRFDGSVFGLDQEWFNDGAVVWNLVWAILLLVLVTLWLVDRSRFGRLLVAIRENEERARFSGFSTYWPRVLAFTLSGFIAGLAGVLMVLSNSFVSPENLSWYTSGNALIVAILGGIGVISGPAVGAFVFLYAQDWLSSLTERFYIIVGIAVIATVIFAPGGIAGIARAAIHKVAPLVRSKERK